MEENNYLSKTGKVLRFFGAINKRKGKVKMLHPIGFLLIVFCFIISPIIAIFSSLSIFELWKDIADQSTFW